MTTGGAPRRSSPSPRLRLLAVFALLATALLCAPNEAGATSARGAADRCTDVTIPVTSTGGSEKLSARLCAPADATVVQVLVPGTAYDKTYWDFPYAYPDYSYASAANKAGYATLALDPLGTGKSSHPPSALVTYGAQASAVHQAIQAARDGKLGRSFPTVVLVGHSYGSIVSYQEAGEYQDVDALVATGASHLLNSANLLARVLPATTPAVLDPKFRDSGLDPGYITTRAGERKVFHDLSNTDPAVIEEDERLKSTTSAVSLLTSLPYSILGASRNISIPVFTLNATEDPLACGTLSADCSSAEALAAFERPFYGPGATVEAAVVPGDGHDLNLSRSAQANYTKILDFLDRHIGP